MTRFVSPLELDDLGSGVLPAGADARAVRQAGKREWVRLFGRSGKEGADIRRTRAAAAVVGEGPCRTLFAHAGVRPELARPTDPPTTSPHSLPPSSPRTSPRSLPATAHILP